MPRPREFNSQDALQKAMGIFWAQGYRAASLQDLTKAMEISKSSFYDTFGSKHELFISAIDHYSETIAKPRAAAVIAEADSVKAGIATVFRNAADSVMEGGENRGCFLNNCAGEVAPHDALATKHLAAGIKHIEEAWYGSLNMARDVGESDPGREPRALARYLAAALNGLIVVCKVRPEPDLLDDIIGVTLAALD